MKEYKSSIRNEKRLYKTVRKNYKRWIYGNIGVVIFLLVVIGMQLWIFKNAEISIESIIIGVGINFVPFLLLCFSRAIAVSGGREVLMNREKNKLVIHETGFTMEYIPSMSETIDYSYIVYEMDYNRVTKIVNREELGYIDVYGEHVIKRYPRVGNGKAVIEHRCEPPMRLYYSYDNLLEAIGYIGERSGCR